MTAWPARLLASVAVLLALLGLAAPAGAAGLRADLNADGVLDTALVRQSSVAAQIELRLSGTTQPQYLLAPSTVHALHSVDLTGDGRTDLVADSAAGLLVWVNTGHRFVPVPVSVVLTRGLTPVAGSAPDSGQPQASAVDTSSPSPALANPSIPAPESGDGPHRFVHTLVLPRTPCAVTITRAPPSVA